MHPIILHLGPLTIYTYGLMLVVALLTVTALAGRAAKTLPHAPLSPAQAADVSYVALIGGILGGRLLFVLLNWSEFAAAPMEIAAIWRGGLVWYGGFFGGLAAVRAYVAMKRLPFLRVLDFYAPYIALGHAIGRIGCFFNGCCYGKPTDSWCGVVFPGQLDRVIPTQLLEALGLAIIFLVLRRLPRAAFAAYLMLYALLRFCLEFLRGDQAMWWGGFTLQQLISVAVGAAGLALFFLFRDAHLPVSRPGR